MAKASRKPGGAPAALKPRAPTDPLAGKSEAERKAVLEAAATRDEAAKARDETDAGKTAPFTPPTPPAAPKATPRDDRAVRHAARMKEYEAHMARKARGLVVDEKVKAQALALIRKVADHDAAVRAARLRRDDKALALPLDEAHQIVVDARAKRAAVKAELNALYSKSPDSVQAAETEAAAGQ